MADSEEIMDRYVYNHVNGRRLPSIVDQSILWWSLTVGNNTVCKPAGIGMYCAYPAPRTAMGCEHGSPYVTNTAHVNLPFM